MVTDINNPAAASQAQSTMATFWDGMCGGNKAHFAHWPSGGNVLYLDGHVEWNAFSFLKKDINGAPFFNDTDFPFGATGFAIHKMEAIAWDLMAEL